MASARRGEAWGSPAPWRSCARSASRVWTVLPGRVLERQLRPLGAVAVGTTPAAHSAASREQRDGIPRAAGAEQVIATASEWAPSARAEPRRPCGLLAASPRASRDGELFSHERVPEAVTAAGVDRAHLPLAAAPSASSTRSPPGECRELGGPEAVIDHGQRREQPNRRGARADRAAARRPRAAAAALMISPRLIDAASSSAKNGLPAADRSIAASTPAATAGPRPGGATSATAARSSGPSATSTAKPRSSRLERRSAAPFEGLVAHPGDNQQALPDSRCERGCARAPSLPRQQRSGRR